MIALGQKHTQHKIKPPEKQRQELLRNHHLEFNENAVVAKNIYEQGRSESPEFANVGEYFKSRHPMKAREVICLSS